MSIKHFLMLFVICVIWGFTFVAGKAAVEEIPPILFTGLRYLLLCLLLLPFLKIVPGRMPYILMLSFFLGSAHFVLFYGGMKVAENVSAVAVVTQLGVPISTVLSVFLLNETIGGRRLFGILAAFVGVVIISFDPAVADERIGIWLVLGSAILGAYGTILMKQIRQIGVYQMQAWIATLSFAPLFAVSLVFEDNHIEVLQSASWVAWGGVAFTAFGASLIGHAGMYYLLKKYDVSVISPLTLMAPVFGVIFGVLVWGDELSMRFWIGGSITLFGVLMIALRKREVAPAGSVL
ncbi:MAG: DMT family transporter [Alphaproteobacteria bacterium]|nr:DMT family transporter [Alphaproteobacteria bacterium]MBE8220957.1 DMT family transporter [Alphaproteobacteria bacterium]